MHRHSLRNLLHTYLDSHPDEADTARRVIDFVERNPDCFERSLEEGHITGSAWIVDSSGTNTLLTHHRKLGIWLQLGGHADGDSDVLSVAMTEAVEESGLTSLEIVCDEIFDLDVHGIPAREKTSQHTFITTSVFCSARRGRRITSSARNPTISRGFRWPSSKLIRASGRCEGCATKPFASSSRKGRKLYFRIA